MTFRSFNSIWISACVVLDRNLFAIDSYEISDAYITMTIFDSQTVYTRTE